MELSEAANVAYLPSEECGSNLPINTMSTPTRRPSQLRSNNNNTGTDNKRSPLQEPTTAGDESSNQLAQAVDELLDQLQDKFDKVSAEIFEKCPSVPSLGFPNDPNPFPCSPAQKLLTDIPAYAVLDQLEASLTTSTETHATTT
ncbi:hypothetical protein PAAG_02483 [Paracoccidioides lutzii Pb01]|uniref:Uncharacterized protein n=1 Tax=Paracoccidioides lutzii (strain ATCC MYA-826 / Pb01) TaxID=502779 RepID=C1GV10_PARBA|nr:hypothetical protein PAAG_02483 [Paracoccidioides lutzii Pb01]EEH40428.2 hypothetical protein PAAG_02483 [Paracoccidioides lutzii Pb01]